MTPREYIKKAMRTDRSDEGYVDHNQKLTGSKGRLTNGALGLAGEAGEVVDLIKKHVQYNKPLDLDEVREELGDLLWYVALIIYDLDLTFEEIMAKNIDKLDMRFPKMFSEEAAIQRQDEE